MSEDMTYDAEPTRAQLAQRVAELERENGELRGKLDAVPVGAISYMVRWDNPTGGAVDAGIRGRVTAWLKTLEPSEVQP